MKTGRVAIAFVGDGGSNQGTTFESYNLASLEPAGDLHRRGQRLRGIDGPRMSVAEPGRARNGFGMPSMKSTVPISSSSMSRARGDRARPCRRRADPDPHKVHALLRGIRGRRRDLQGRRRGRKYKAAKDPLKLFRGRVTEAAAGGQGARRHRSRMQAAHPACVALAKSAKSPTEADLLTDVYTSAY